MKRIVVIIILLVDIILLEGCKKSAIPLGNGDFNSFHFNDYLTSLDKGENDSLLIGTANGKLIVFDPKTSANYSRHVGNERVYFSYQHTSGFFVGIRNEGLKWYLKDGSLKKQFKLAGKDTQYSVYNVEKYHDTLFCATSSGLCLIDLNKIDSDSLLTLVYPKLSPNHEAPDDFKIDPIQCIQDTLYAAYSQDSTTKLLVFPINQGSIEEPRSYSSDKIESFYASPFPKENTLCIVRKNDVVLGKDSFKKDKGSFKSLYYREKADYPFLFVGSERLVAANKHCLSNAKQKFLLTMPDKSHAETAKIINQGGYSYWITGKTLCAIPNHISKGTQITAIDQWDDIVVATDQDNAIYQRKNSENKFKFDYNISGIENKKIENIVMLSEKDMCVLSDGSIFYGSSQKGFKDIGSIFSIFKYESFHQILYDSAQERLFFAYRRGYAFCDVKNGEIQPNSLCFDTTIKSAQSIFCVDSSSIYIGMLNHGCLKRQIINGKFAGPVDTINRHHNIIDITKIGNYYYYLTPAKLFRDTVEVATDIKNLYIQKIYHVQNNLIGLSRTGGLYLFDLDSNVMKGPYLSDVYFYPNAIVLVQDSILEAGTNIGIIRLNPNNLDTIIQNVDVKMFFVTRLKNHILEHMENIIHFGLPAILFLFIIFVVLLVLIAFLAKKRTSLNNEIKNLQNDRKEVVNNLKRDSLLNIPNEDPHSVYFQNYCDQIKPIRDKIREIDMSSPNFQESIKDIKSEITTPSVLRSALNLEIENLNVWYKTNEPFQDTKKLDEFKNRIEAISKNCLENIIGFTKTFKQPTKGKFNNDRKQYYLTTCVLCLFAHQTKNFKIIDNQYLSIILNPICLDAKDENNNKKRRMNYVSGLKKDILNNFDEEGNDSKRKRKRKEGEKPEKKEIFKCKDGTDSEMSELYKEIMEAIKEVLEYNL